jgi:outer membrane protein, multidrug efflux system
MKAFKYITGIFLILLLFYSCKSLQPVIQDNSTPLPSSFDNKAGDSSNMATIRWDHFFNDKNLASLIDTALMNNWDVLIAFQRMQAAQSDVLVSKGALNPTVAGGVAAGINKFGLYTMDGAGNKGTTIYNGNDIPEHLPDYFVGLQTTWEIDLWGKLRNRKKAAIARFLATVEGRNLVKTGLIAEIASFYYELLALDQTIKILNENITIREKAYRMVKVQKEADVTNELAVKQFEAQLLNLQASRLQVLQQIAETENRINLLAGRYPGTIMRDTSFFDNTSPLEMKAGIPSALLQNRPDIRQAELELMASKADVQAAKAAFYPSLNINGSVGFQAFKAGLLFTAPKSVAYGLLGSLTAPLINRTAIKAEFNRANAFQLELLYNYQKTIVNGYVEVYNELLRTKNLQQVFDVKTREAIALTQSIDISEKLFRTGRANYLEVLFAQQNALQARLELVETKKSQLLTTVNMYKALGGGWR